MTDLDSISTAGQRAHLSGIPRPPAATATGSNRLRHNSPDPSPTSESTQPCLRKQRHQCVWRGLGEGSFITIFLDTSMITPTIISTIVPESERMSIVDSLFGMSYMLKLEPAVLN